MDQRSDLPTVAQMLWAEQAIMRRGKLVLDHIIQTQAEQGEGGYSGYLARN